MKIVAIADTHGLHREMAPLPAGDVLIHAGDFTHTGSLDEVDEFGQWFAAQPHEFKVLIAGNHDASLQLGSAHAQQLLHAEIIYLEDRAVTIEGVKFYGSPWTPTFNLFFFMANHAEIKDHWAKIPDDTDVLITHGPPSGFLDVTMEGRHEGCPRLRKEVLERVRPELHVFGHIHEAYGVEQASAFRERTQTVFVNASMLNRDYELTNAPVVVSVRRP